MNKKTQAGKINALLKEMYPSAVCTLYHENPLQLLVATQLSAQSTDARVNLITPALFEKYPTAEAFASADLSELEQDIFRTGFYRNKARNIKICCMQLLERHSGRVPDTMEEMVALAGVGRKTANVVLGTCFGIPGIVVDTHASRLAKRMGLTDEKSPEKIESALMAILPKKEWTGFSHRLVSHGRALCGAIKAQCGLCGIRTYCFTGQKTVE